MMKSSMIHTTPCQMTMPPTQQKLKLLKVSHGLMVSVFLLVLLVSSLVFPQSSNAGGVNSNTITNGSSSSVVIGNPTISGVTNDDGSQTITQTTPTVTTTTTTTVTQTEVPNIVQNPTFTNHLGGGSSSNWSITTCPGGCAFSPAFGFMAGNGGTITQTFNQTDLFGNEIDSTEQGQGLTFTFGAEVDNNQANNNVGDTWLMRLEMYDSSNVSLGSSLIGDSLIFPPTIKTGYLEIDSGFIPNSGILTLYGNSAYNGGTCCAAFFNDVFTTYMYNSIETSIDHSTTYAELITTVSCDTLNSCVSTPTEEPITTIIDIVETTAVQDTAILAPAPIAPIAELPTQEIVVPTTIATVTEIETVAEIQIAEIETEIDNGFSKDTEKGGADTQSVENKDPDNGSTDTGVRTDSSKEETENEGETTKPVGVKKPQPKKMTKAQAKQKVGQKIVKDMGDTKRYEGSNQIRTIVVMQVLGGQKDFFNAQIQLKDTPNFFSNAKIPDNNISDNNYTSYFLFGGSDSDHNDLIESQYRR